VCLDRYQGIPNNVGRSVVDCIFFGSADDTGTELILSLAAMLEQTLITLCVVTSSRLCTDKGDVDVVD
jgi:hypothetical protein